VADSAPDGAADEAEVLSHHRAAPFHAWVPVVGDEGLRAVGLGRRTCS
jgi:hypothetical protein